MATVVGVAARTVDDASAYPCWRSRIVSRLGVLRILRFFCSCFFSRSTVRLSLCSGLVSGSFTFLLPSEQFVLGSYYNIG